MPRKTAEQLLEEQERALVGQAIAETEQEIFDDALSLDPDDNTGDTSLEQMDGEDVLDSDELEDEDEEGEEGETEGEEGEDEGDGEETPPETRHQPDDRQQDRRGVPPARLREEAEARRVAEAEARELRARIEALERDRQRPPAQRQDQTQTEGPDMFADPEGWARAQRETIAREMNERRINDSFASAIDDLGRESVDAAVAALAQTRNPALVSEILNSHNPGKVVVRWHERQQAMAEIGEDPAAYRERVRQELLQDPETRRAVISGARTDAMRGDRGTPRTQTRLPPSLNSATGGTSHRAGITAPRRSGSAYSPEAEREIADSVWDD